MCPSVPPNMLGDVKFSEEHYPHEIFYKKRKIGQDKYNKFNQKANTRAESFCLPMEALAIKDLLNPGGLAYPINMMETSKDIAIIIAMLSAFTTMQSYTLTQLGIYGLFKAPKI